MVGFGYLLDQGKFFKNIYKISMLYGSDFRVLDNEKTCPQDERCLDEDVRWMSGKKRKGENKR